MAAPGAITHPFPIGEIQLIALLLNQSAPLSLSSSGEGLVNFQGTCASPAGFTLPVEAFCLSQEGGQSGSPVVGPEGACGEGSAVHCVRFHPASRRVPAHRPPGSRRICGLCVWCHGPGVLSIYCLVLPAPRHSCVSLCNFREDVSPGRMTGHCFHSGMPTAAKVCQTKVDDLFRYSTSEEVCLTYPRG